MDETPVDPALIAEYGQRLYDAAVSGDATALVKEGERTIAEIGDLAFMAALAALAGASKGLRLLAALPGTGAGLRRLGSTMTQPVPALPSGYKAVPCKGCGALLVWATNERTGNAVPLEAAPSVTGNMVLLDGGVCRQAEGTESRREDLHGRHVCPQRAQFSRPRGGKGEAD